MIKIKIKKKSNKLFCHLKKSSWKEVNRVKFNVFSSFLFLSVLSFRFIYNFSDALSSGLSALYAKIIVILGVALPVTEVLTSRIPSIVYQSFYVYLYGVSVLFVLFVYMAHMRTRAVFSLIKVYRKCVQMIHLIPYDCISIVFIF